VYLRRQDNPKAAAVAIGIIGEEMPILPGLIFPDEIDPFRAFIQVVISGLSVIQPERCKERLRSLQDA
jgi:hypothetical protein